MQKQKGVTTLVGIIIIVVAALILFGGVFAYQYFAKSQTSDTKSQINSEGDTRLIDSECLKKNPNPPESNWCYQIYHDGQWVGIN